jgi:hypothetical protein
MGHTRVTVPWCDTIAKESNNRMRCQILPAMSGGGTPGQLVDRVKDGVDDLTITLPGYTPGRFPIMEAFELPFMTNTADVASAAAAAVAAVAVAAVAVAAVAAAVVAAAAVRAPHPLRQRPSGRSYAPRSKGAPTCRQRLRWRAHEVLRHLLVAPSHLWHTTARAGAGSLRTRPAPRADRL